MSKRLKSFERRIAVTQEVVDRMLSGRAIAAAEQPYCKVCYSKIDCGPHGEWFHTNVHDNSHTVGPLIQPTDTKDGGIGGR